MSKRNIKYVFSERLIKQADKNPAVKGRASLVHELIKSYGLLDNMTIVNPLKCNKSDLRHFHSKDYVEKLYELEMQAKHEELSSDEENDESFINESDFNLSIDNAISEEYGLGFDCPVSRNIMEYCCTIAGATMTACHLLTKSSIDQDRADVIVNWTGGWHHAHRDKAAGFCYINDIVLGILILRNKYQRILYVDLDVHHGDGVQEAFETTKRVFTLSFHKQESGFFPGTGSANDCGIAGGKGYTVNFPYKSGIQGAAFKAYFKEVSELVLSLYQPEVLVLQCGGDVIVGDPLGGTNLIPSDLIYCIESLMATKLPIVLLGGGGYHFTNTSRYWTEIVAAILNHTLENDIPDNEFFLKYGPDYELSISKQNNLRDFNTNTDLENNLKIIKENLQKYQVTAV